MSDLDRERESSEAAPQPIPSGAALEKLQRLFLSAFVHQQERVRKQIDHTGRLAAVLSIQQEITSREPDLEEVLTLVSNRAINILGATGSAIALQRNGSMICRASGGATGPALGAHLSSEFGLSGECLRSGQPMLCNDVDKDSRVDTAAAQSLGIRSLIVAPVFHHRTTVGVLEVFSSEPDFFEKEDAHVVELLGGMITTAISYSSEFEAKKTLQSERNAMLEVIERITPTITKMLAQKPVDPALDSAMHTDGDEVGRLPSSDVEEEIAHSAEIDFGEEMMFGEIPGPTQHPVFTSEKVSDDAGKHDFAGGNHLEHTEEEQVEPAGGDSEPVEEAEEEYETDEPTEDMPRRYRADDHEKRAVDSAIEILLAKEQILDPDAPDSVDAAPESAHLFFRANRRPLPSQMAAKPAVAPTRDDDFEWPEPDAPPLPPGSAIEHCESKIELPEVAAKEATAKMDSGSSIFGEWSPPALLQTRRQVSAPRGDPSGNLVPSAASTTDFFTLSPELPPIPPTGALPASKAVGAPSAPLGRSRGGTALTLRLRNIMEYAVPAVLTGLLIVVGLQFLSTNQIPSLLGTKGLKAPPPSMFTPMHAAPVEVSLLRVPGASGLVHNGKEINNRVSAIVPFDRGTTDDWTEPVRKLGQAIGDKLPSPPSTTPDNSRGGPAISGLEKVLPSNAFGDTPASAAKLPRIDANSPVAQVHLPVEIVDDYVLVRVQPLYPQVAQQNNLTGTVVLNTVIGRDGAVRDVRAVSGNKYLAEAALAAVSQWRYKPFVLNGKPIEVATEVRIAFTRRLGTQKAARERP